MCGRNDATKYMIARGNCSYCAVGALLAQTASQVMRDVYGKLGKLPPDGDMESRDGAEGFAEYYIHTQRPVKGPVRIGRMEAQIKGIEIYLRLRGFETRRLKGNGEFEFLKPSDTVAAIQRESEGTLFLAMTGENFGGLGVGYNGAHWSVGQVRSGKAKFYDHQLDVSEDNVRRRLVKKAKTPEAKAMYGKTRVTDRPPGPHGTDLDEHKGRALIVVLRREGTVLRSEASADLRSFHGIEDRVNLPARSVGAGQIQTDPGRSGPG